MEVSRDGLREAWKTLRQCAKRVHMRNACIFLSPYRLLILKGHELQKLKKLRANVKVHALGLCEQSHRNRRNSTIPSPKHIVSHITGSRRAGAKLPTSSLPSEQGLNACFVFEDDTTPSREGREPPIMADLTTVKGTPGARFSLTESHGEPGVSPWLGRSKDVVPGTRQAWSRGQILAQAFTP